MCNNNKNNGKNARVRFDGPFFGETKMEHCGSPAGDGGLHLRAHPTTFTTNVDAVEAAFEQLAASPEVNRVVLDMTKVFRLDSRGLRALVDLQGRLVDRGGQLVLVNVSLAVQRLLEYARLDDFFEIQKTGAPKAARSRPVS